MQIQRTQVTAIRLNNIYFQKKYVQPDSFINAPKRKKKPSEIDLISVERIIAKKRDEKINGYVKDSKKELKDIQKTAIAHKKQCLGILKKGEKFGYTGTIDCDDYNLTFAFIDPKTNKPSVINIWDDGKMVQQYKINSIEPCNIKVYDCELDTFNEEFSIVDGQLSKYVAIKPKENTIKMLIPLSSSGFYKAEGEIAPYGTYVTDDFNMTKKREITYEPRGFSYYTEHKNGNKSIYLYDSISGNWKPILKD